MRTITGHVKRPKQYFFPISSVIVKNRKGDREDRFPVQSYMRVRSRKVTGRWRNQSSRGRVDKPWIQGFTVIAPQCLALGLGICRLSSTGETHPRFSCSLFCFMLFFVTNMVFVLFVFSSTFCLVTEKMGENRRRERTWNQSLNLDFFSQQFVLGSENWKIWTPKMVQGSPCVGWWSLFSCVSHSEKA